MAETKIKGLFVRLFEKFREQKTPEDTKNIATLNMDEYKQELHTKGVAGVKEKLSRDLDDWKTIPLNTAVVGNSGTGKSSFINALRGLRAKQSGAAEVGVNETTATCQQYTHPDNESFIVWDPPGVGTPKFPKEYYLKAIEYDKYDFFIIMSRGRFTENDMWLAREIQKRNKTFFFVRSNIDIDIDNDKADNPDHHDENKLLQTIRETTVTELEKCEIKEPKVFLINNRKRDKFDFRKLNNELLLSCDGLKKDSMALTLAAVTKEVMAEKKRVLRGRIPRIALKVASISIEYEQKRIFQDEVQFYQKQFDIDDATIAANKDIWTLSDQHVKEFHVVFDQYLPDGQMNVETPTALREKASGWERFKDFFRWSNENKIIYVFCELGLRQNLDILYKHACKLYDIPRTKQLVHSVKK